MKRIGIGMLLSALALASTGCLVHTGPSRPVVVHDHGRPVVVEHDHDHHDHGKHKGWEKHRHDD